MQMMNWMSHYFIKLIWNLFCWYNMRNITTFNLVLINLSIIFISCFILFIRIVPWTKSWTGFFHRCVLRNYISIIWMHVSSHHNLRMIWIWFWFLFLTLLKIFLSLFNLFNSLTVFLKEIFSLLMLLIIKIKWIFLFVCNLW